MIGGAIRRQSSTQVRGRVYGNRRSSVNRRLIDDDNLASALQVAQDGRGLRHGPPGEGRDLARRHRTPLGE